VPFVIFVVKFVYIQQESLTTKPTKITKKHRPRKTAPPKQGHNFVVPSNDNSPPLQPAWYDQGWPAYLLDWTYPQKRRLIGAFVLGCALGAIALPLSAYQHDIDVTALNLAAIFHGQRTGDIISLLIPAAFYPILLGGFAAGSARMEWIRFGNQLQEKVGRAPNYDGHPQAYTRYKRLEGVPFLINLVTVTIGLLSILILGSLAYLSFVLVLLAVWAYFAWKLERFSRAERKRLSDVHSHETQHE